MFDPAKLPVLPVGSVMEPDVCPAVTPLFDWTVPESDHPPPLAV